MIFCKLFGIPFQPVIVNHYFPIANTLLQTCELCNSHEPKVFFYFEGTLFLLYSSRCNFLTILPKYLTKRKGEERLEMKGSEIDMRRLVEPTHLFQSSQSTFKLLSKPQFNDISYVRRMWISVVRLGEVKKASSWDWKIMTRHETIIRHSVLTHKDRNALDGFEAELTICW